MKKPTCWTTQTPDKFYIFAIILFTTALFLIYDLFNTEMYQCPKSMYSSSSNLSPGYYKPKPVNRLFGIKALDRDFQFDMDGSDVMVSLHIQKTGGSNFERKLVKLGNTCNCTKGIKKCECARPGTSPKEKDVWLVSRFSTGWSCGLHADWTELTNCVPQHVESIYKGEAKKKRRYFYVTMLRDPVHRYISEWKHVQRGATWKTALHMCDGRVPTSEELPVCYEGENWLNVPLDDFMNCKYNLANNRQTRMLADLSLVGCYNISKMPEEERKQMMLRSAKRNLRRLAFFGLTEYQRESQFVFEETFKLKFDFPFEQHPTHGEQSSATPQQYDRIRYLNSLDIELYQFAKTLFFQRKTYMEAKIKRAAEEQ